jgi:hypothetical protein
VQRRPAKVLAVRRIVKANRRGWGGLMKKSAQTRHHYPFLSFELWRRLRFASDIAHA